MRGGQLEHPANVLRRYEMPRRPKHMGTEDPARVKGALDPGVGCSARHPQTQSPLCGRELLGLDRAQPGDEPCGIAGPGMRDEMVEKADPCYLPMHARHYR